MRRKRYLIAAAVVLAGAFLLAGSRSNPPVENAVAWDAPETEALFRRACADCHSHETRWPWYAHVAPASWLVIRHVDEARGKFNVSVPRMGDAADAAEELLEGKMPLPGYGWLHSEARLTDPERALLIAGLRATFGGELGDAR